MLKWLREKAIDLHIKGRRLHGWTDELIYTEIESQNRWGKEQKKYAKERLIDNKISGVVD